MKSLEAAAAEECFVTLLEKVHVHGESFTILKKGIPYAQLVPATDLRCDSHQFAQDLSEEPLEAKERRAMGEGLRKSRKSLKPLANPWA